MFIIPGVWGSLDIAISVKKKGIMNKFILIIVCMCLSACNGDVTILSYRKV